MRICRHFPQILLIGIIVLVNMTTPVLAQDASSRRPIDMMILIDNSCSMFPANQIVVGCDASGSDPDYLRIVGADLFIARLGFSEPNEGEYRLGVISVGSDTQTISPLQPLSAIRTQLASKISNPRPQTATRIIPALEEAYKDLKNAAGPNDGHTRAIVMVSDGVPWPREEQPNSSIEKLISENADTPLFMMLLKNTGRNTTDYESYIQFWESLQAKFTNLNVYRIESASQIAETYNKILGQLQSSIPTRRIELKANSQTSLPVSAFAQRLILTAIRKAGQRDGQLTIKDPLGNPIQEGDPGVNYFHTRDNPVEVYSISAPRLGDDTKGKDWTVVSSGDMNLMVDLVGAYQISFTNPVVKAAEITNQFVAVDRQSPSRELVLTYNLVDGNGGNVTVPQPINLTVTSPDGETTKQVTRQNLPPDSQGNYQLRVDLQALFPGIANQSGRYTFNLDSGELDPGNPDTLPVSSVRLYIDFGNIPYIRSVAPVPLTCLPGQPAELRVSVGDFNTTEVESIKVRAFTEGSSLWLESKGDGVFRGDVTSLCNVLVASIGCSSVRSTQVTLQLDSVLVGGMQLPSSSKNIETNVTSQLCTPTPLPTATLQPTPTPPPPPDSDRDGLLDTADRCPNQYGPASYGGCMPWALFGYAGGGLGFIAILGLVVWPLIKVNRLVPAPDVYLLACRDGKRVGDPVSIQKVSRKRLASRVIIGGSRSRAHIVIPGLLSNEYYVEWHGGMASLRDPKDREPFAFFTEEPRIVRTSDPKVILHIGTDPESLGCS